MISKKNKAAGWLIWVDNPTLRECSLASGRSADAGKPSVAYNRFLSHQPARRVEMSEGWMRRLSV